MKICPRCSNQNEDSMSFCVQCGSALPSQMVVNLTENEPKTEIFHGSVPTNAGTHRETETFAANQGNFGNNLQQPPPTFQQQAVPPVRPKSNAKIFLAIGGVGLIILLFAVAGAAVIGYNLLSRPKPTPYPTTAPTRVIASLSPTPSFSPNISPTVAPSGSPAFSPTVAPSGSPSTTHPSNASAKFDKMSVDYNVSENNQYGMRIHVTFSTFNLKGVDSYLAVFFQKKDGSALFSNNDVYRSKNGQVAVFKALKPLYDEALFKDLQLFIPYTELNLTPGKYNLQMISYVLYQNGDVVQKMNTYDFQYEALNKN